VVSVLDSVLAEKPYLVGDKVTIADFVFLPWQQLLGYILEGSEYLEEVKTYKNFLKCHEALLEHPAAKRMMELRERADQG
jgi:glutathione S-transferase